MGPTSTTGNVRNAKAAQPVSTLLIMSDTEGQNWMPGRPPLPDGWCQKHFEAFATCLPKEPLPDRLGARNPREMASKLGVSGTRRFPFPVKLGTSQQTYESVLSYTAAPSTPIGLACVSILAWGGMRMDNARRVFSQPENDWLELCSNIRDGGFTRSDAYQAFLELRPKVQNRSRLSGVGPAYWTKLIHFLMPRDESKPPPGYILDQWAGASVNLIVGSNVVKMDRHTAWVWKRGEPTSLVQYSAIVSELTSAVEYENFCQCLEHIAELSGRSHQAVDCGFMSLGEGDWRNYLKENYLKLHG